MEKKESPAGQKRRLNSLDGKKWTRYSISIWDTTKSAQELKIKHPAMFPGELVKRFLEIYTKPGDTVLDPFLGSGSTLVVSNRLGRKGIGFEIADKFVKFSKERLQQEILSQVPMEQQIIHKVDARNLVSYVRKNTVDLVITSPPYWDIQRQKRTADYKQSMPYSELEYDLGNIDDYNEFLSALKQVFTGVFHVLKKKKWCIVIVMDLRKKAIFYPFHMDVANFMNDIGFELEDIIIWDRRQEYNNLRPLGYPYVFRVNKVHEYIMIFRKP